MTPTLSVIIASAGRRLSLGDTLAALVMQLGDGDEALVVWDGSPSDEVLRIVRDWRAQCGRVRDCHIAGGPHGDWGHHARNGVLGYDAWAGQGRMVRGSHLLFIDDDDAHRPDALAHVRAALTLAPDVPHLFRVEVHHEKDGGVIWADREVRLANVSTQMIVTPNVPSKLGRFNAAKYAGDFDFIRDTIALHGDRVVWDESIIADIFPTRDR